MKKEDDMSVVMTQEQYSKIKERIGDAIYDWLSKNQNKTDNDFAKLAGLSRSEITSLKNKKGFKTMPKQSTIRKIAKVTGYSYNYLMGIDDEKNADEILEKEKAFKKIAVQNINDFLDKLDVNMSSTKIANLDDRYFDIIGHILNDMNFWYTLIYEADWFISNKNDNDKIRDFENLHNKNDYWNYNAPTRLEMDEFVKSVISKSLIDSFFKYVRNKEKEIIPEEQALTPEELKEFYNIKKKRKKT